MALKAENILGIAEIYSAVALEYLKSHDALEVLSGLIYASERLKCAFEKLNIVSPEAIAIMGKELKQAVHQNVEKAWMEKVKQIIEL